MVDDAQPGQPDSTDGEPIDVDPVVDTHLRLVLSGLTFLRPDPSGEPATAGGAAAPMPTEVWDRLSAAIDAESASRAEVVVPLRPRRTGGLRAVVAAAAVVVVAGLALATVRGTGGSVVATDADGSTPAIALAEKAAAGPAEAAAPAPSDAMDDGTSDPGTVALGAAGAPASRVVLASSTDYSADADTLRTQVQDLVEKRMGYTTPDAMMNAPASAAPLPLDGGFTTSWSTLRTCIERLLGVGAQALLVDRATYEKQDAGLVVALASAADDALSVSGTVPDSPTATPTTTIAAGPFLVDVWVVDPTCDRVASSLQDFPLFAWQR